MPERMFDGNGRSLTMEALANAKCLPVTFLTELGVHDLPTGGVGIPYYGPAGEELFVRDRESPRHPGKRFWQPKGVPLAAYGQWRLDKANKAGSLNVVEGESDCWALWHHGFPALGIPGAGAAKTIEHEHIEAVQTVYVHREPDRAAEKFVADVGNRLAALGFASELFEIRMPDGIKDPADLHAADPERFQDRMKEAMSAAKRLELPKPPELNGRRQGIRPGALSAADEDGRPVIRITTNESLFNQQAIAALATHPHLFQRGTGLVTVIRNAKPNKRIMRQPETPIIHFLPTASVREMMTEVATFLRYDKRSELWEPAHPPGWAAGQIAVRGSWPDIRPLVGIVETPVLMPDGSVLSEPGYDAGAGYLYLPNADYPPLPETITQSDAFEAAEQLLELVREIPFDNPSLGMAVFLSAVLTPLARPAIDGVCPAHVFTANAAGSGKTLQADLVSIIALGRDMPRTGWSREDAEIRKTITAIILEGHPLCLFDNLGHDMAFGGPSIDRALTSCTWSDRILGKNETSRGLELKTVFYATGNNIQLQGDINRRILMSKIEVEEDRPEERQGFRIPDLLGHARQERGRLVAAGLRILRGFALAGRPPQPIPVFGGFGPWSRTVREAIFWATRLDCKPPHQELDEMNRSANFLPALLDGWKKLQGEDTQGITVSEALKRLQEDAGNQHAELREIVMGWSRTKDLPTVGIVAHQLRACKKKRSNGKWLENSPDDAHRKVRRWRVAWKNAGIAGDENNVTRQIGT